MQPPVINLNGDKAETLAYDCREALRALQTAAEAVQTLRPNPRNYYNQPEYPDNYIQAQNDHTRMVNSLLAIRKEIEDLHKEIRSQGR